jgi:serine/threonine-protein kinase RsbW
VPGLAVAVRYLPASRGADVGGDFYDVVPLPDGQVALAVGDVVGHDITAAAVMGSCAASTGRCFPTGRRRARSSTGCRQGWSLLGLQLMATALFAVLEPETGRLRMASAGHPAPLLVAGGKAELLDVRPSRMLGAPPAPGPAVEWGRGARPGGDAAALHRRAGGEPGRRPRPGPGDADGRAVRAGTNDPDELCDRLLAELASGVRADDVALLAITRRP